MAWFFYTILILGASLLGIFKCTCISVLNVYVRDAFCAGLLDIVKFNCISVQNSGLSNFFMKTKVVRSLQLADLLWCYCLMKFVADTSGNILHRVFRVSLFFVFFGYLYLSTDVSFGNINTVYYIRWGLGFVLESTDHNTLFQSFVLNYNGWWLCDMCILGMFSTTVSLL